MSSLHFAIAFIPVAVYFILIGGLRLRTRPLVTTGWRDTLTLGIAAIGLVMIGPMQLFFPDRAADQLQGWVWFALLALYLLGLFLVLLSSKPRLIAYGLDETQFRDALLSAAQSVDEAAQWSGDVLSLPASGIQLAYEPSGTTKVQQVSHVGLLHDLQEWLKLEQAFVRSGGSIPCKQSIAGWPFVMIGLALLAFAIYPMVSDPQDTLAQFKAFFSR